MRRAPSSVIVVLSIAVLAHSAGADGGLATDWFGLADWRGNLFIRGKAHLNNQESRNTDTRETGWLFEQGLTLGNSGYVYHPNLLQWQGFVRVGASQERTDFDEESSRAHGSLLGYSISGMVLRQKPIRLRWFAHQNEDLRDRSFSGSVRTRRESQGAELMFSGDFTSALLLERIERQEDGDSRDEDEQTCHLRFTTTHRPNLDMYTQLIYDHYDTDEEATYETSGPSDTVTQNLPDTSDEINVTNMWRFGGEAKPISVTGRLRALDRRGFFDNELLTVDQQLNWQHTESFSTFYRGLFDYNQTGDQTDRIYAGEIGLRQSIYESLDLELRGLGTTSELGEATEDSIGGFFEADYRKRTPIGLYTSALLLGRECQHEQSPFGVVFVQDRPILLVGLSYSSLGQPNIDEDSIVVTNLDKTEVYDEEADYILRTTGTLIEIARVADGDILDGQTVLVSFTAQVATDAEYIIDHTRWTQSLQFKEVPLDLYTEYRSMDESLRRGDDPGNLDTIRSLLFGAEYTYRDLVATLEHEDVDQELSPPWKADRIRLVYSQTVNPTVAASASGFAERLRYDDADEFGLVGDDTRLDTLGAHVHLTTKLRRDLLMRFNSGVTDSQGRENRTTFTNGVFLKWQYGKLSVTLDAKYDRYTQEETTGDSFSFMFNLMRRF